MSDPGYKFCPRCGTAFHKRRLKEFEPERLICPQCSFIFYLNPKVAAGTVVEYEGGIVLLRREVEPRAGFWVHPGGFVDRGETLEAAARREAREEVGLDVEIGRLLGAYSFRESEVVVVTFAARTLAGVPIVGDESLEVRIFAPHELPWSDLAFPSTELALREYLRTMDAPTVARTVSRKSAHSALAKDPDATTDGRLDALLQTRLDVQAAKDVRAASLIYPALVSLLREARRFREALQFAEEGLALTHDPLIARLADEVAHELAESERERC
ncbi:MAG: NUDIX hydrolase [Vicinamibacteria bacterium]|nr:NUDIX hydrolase [Vicinamibacteria bacterium]